VIIATAGHVDHGKTALIRQLTGVETDTLAEEKARGLSINLGYAYLPRAEGGSLGFIDVPGHQRFINTMISGISGIDMGLLVVAADDGPMPQTIEHLDVLDILGVNALTVAVSKIDKASRARLGEVSGQIKDLLASRRWGDPALFHVSSADGSGVAALKSHLLRYTQRSLEYRTEGGFRLSIDRRFSARGAGLIVTGTASAGTVRTEDKLLLLPAGIEVRVRGLRADGGTVDGAVAGQRVALNLSGKLDTADIERGDWLVSPDCALCSTRLDVTFSLLPSASFPLKHLAPVKLYIGAKRVAGRLALIHGASRRLDPGKTCTAQLILDRPVSAVLGERFLLRDHAENIVLGGGVVLDPDGPRYGKARPGRLAWLGAMQAPSAGESLARLLDQNLLVDLDRFWSIRNRPVPESTESLPAGAIQFESDGNQWAANQSRWEEAGRHLGQRVDDWHVNHPEQPGIKMTDLQSAMSRRFESALAMGVLVAKLQAGELELRDGHIGRRGFQKTESVQARKHWALLKRHLQACGPQIPLASELPGATRIPESELRQVIKQAIRTGELVRLNDNRYALPEQLRYFSERVAEANRLGQELSVIRLKAVFQSGRKLTIELLEYFDSVHFTKRKGDTRVILNSEVPGKLFGG